MPPNRKRNPTIQQESQELLDKKQELFGKNLRDLAITLAQHEKSEFVLIRHVESAFEAISLCGLKRTSFWRRPELEFAIGGILFGFGPKLCDYLDHMFTEPSTVEWATKTLEPLCCWATTIAGIIFFLVGYFRSRF